MDDFADKGILALVSIDGKNFGFINRLGEWVIEPKYDYTTRYFYEGLAFVGIDKVTTAVIDHDGNIVIPPRKIEGGLKFSEGLAWVRIDGEGWYIDRQGKLLLPTGEGRGFQFMNGLARIMFKDKRNNKIAYSFRFMNKDGYFINNLVYDGSGFLTEGLAWVNLGGKYGYINRLGEIEIELRFDDARPFSEGLAPVKLNDKWGYINHDGEFVIEPDFDSAWPFFKGLACIEKKTRFGFINNVGNVVINPLFKSLDLNIHTFTDELFPVLFHDSKGLRKQYPELDEYDWKNGTYGYIDREGKIQILPSFKHANNFFFGLAGAATDKKIGYIDRDGAFVISEKYQHADWFHNVYASSHYLF